jgi:membrane protease YdiL (CAAX protease family)
MRWRLALDLLIVFGGFGVAFLAPVHAGFFGSGPVAIAAALLLIHWRLRASGESWSALGFTRPASALRLLLVALGLYVAVLAAVSILVHPLAQALRWPPQELGRFAAIRGQPWRLALLLLLAWTSAAFGEEILFRGFLQGRLQRLLGAGAARSALAILIQCAVFGLCHAYLGMRGIANAAVVGLVFGSALIACRGNLWPLILAHGLTDTVTLLLLYLGIPIASS